MNQTMERIRNFLRDKGFLPVLLACILAAAAVSSWVVKGIQSRLEEDTPPASGTTEQKQNEIIAPSVLEGMDEGANEGWSEEAADVIQPVEDVPEEAEISAPVAATPPQSSGGSTANSVGSNSSSGASSGQSSVSEPSELQSSSVPAEEPAVPSCARPVSGRIVNSYSGDELVYNRTMGDWRTHNGTDYACAEGETVLSPVSGVVEENGTDGRLGQFVSIRDEAERLWTLYGITGATVAQGESVSLGQKLGQVGNIPAENNEAVHLHLEIRQGEQYLDPSDLIK